MFLDDFIKQNIKVEGEKVILSDDFLLYLKRRITDEHRFKHSLSVANLVYRVSIANKVEEPLKYYLAAVLHDIGKNADKIEAKEIVDKYYHQYIDYPSYCYHQFVGEYYAIKDLCIFDEEVLGAIKFHCTGNELMSKIEKVVYACDKIDPLRDFDSSELIEAMMRDIDSGFIEVLHANYEYLSSKAHSKEEVDSIFNKLSSKCFKYYLNVERK